MDEVISKGLEDLREFLGHELIDYSVDYEIMADGKDKWIVDIVDNSRDWVKQLYFKYGEHEKYTINGYKTINTLLVLVGEDFYYPVASHDWTVKHFWQALLSWD